MKKIVLIACLLILCSAFSFAGEWNSLGVINQMYIYPTYAVILQGEVAPGPANCQETASWSFAWNQFDAAAQARIQSMLLTAYISQTPIRVVIDSDTCGPENKKKFNGQIHLP